MIRLQDLVDERYVALDLVSTDKADAFRKMVCLIIDCGEVAEEKGEALCFRLAEREQIGTTAVGQGLAIPHCYFEAFSKPIVVFARLVEPIDFSAEDGQPVNKLFLLIGPKRDNTEHLMILARIARLLKDAGFRSLLDTMTSAREFVEAVRRVESRH